MRLKPISQKGSQLWRHTILFGVVFTLALVSVYSATSSSVQFFESVEKSPGSATTTPVGFATSSENTSTTTSLTITPSAIPQKATTTSSGSSGVKNPPIVSTPILPTPNPTPTPVPAPIITPIPVPSPTPTPVIPVPIPTPTPVVEDTLGEQFGLSLAGTLLGLSDSEVGSRLDGVAATGVKWIRIDVGWNDIERRDADHTDWSGIDRIVNAANARGIHVLGILSYTPRWARDDGCPEITCPPADQDQFAAFAEVAAKRYAPKGVHAWEIWNEQNLNLGYWGNSAVRYSHLLRVVYPAIKNVDPNATVISGGLSPAATTDGSMSPVDFLTALYANGAGDSFDAVGMHPYSFPATPNYTIHWNAWSQMADVGNTLRDVMAAHGDGGKKIWLTEFGAATGGPENLATMSNYKSITNSDHVTEELQAEMLRQSFSLVQTYSWAGPLFWYSYKDLGTDENDNENFFGIIRYDGSHKPAYDALRTMLGTN